MREEEYEEAASQFPFLNVLQTAPPQTSGTPLIWILTRSGSPWFPSADARDQELKVSPFEHTV